MIIRLTFLYGLFLLCFNLARCQDSQQPNKSVIIRIDSLYKYYGVIIDSSKDVPIKIEAFKDRYTPKLVEIVNAEMIFLKSYNDANKASPARSNAKYIVDVKKEFKKYNRQYVGFIDVHGDSNIIIQLFDYRKKRIVNREIGDSWKRSFIIMFSEHPHFTTLIYRVNLKEKILYVF